MAMTKHPAEVFGYPIGSVSSLPKKGHKKYWVVQEPVYQDFLNRYNLNDMHYHDECTTVFAIYDLRQDSEKCELFQTRIESSTIDDLFHAFRSNPNIPSKDTFIIN